MPALNIIDLNNGKRDLDHIAELATSAYVTAIDRLGKTKLTMRGALNSLLAFNQRGLFVGGTAYAMKDVYISGGIAYVAVTDHVSSTVAADLAAGKVTVHQGATFEALGAPNGAALVSAISAGAYAVARTLEDRNRDTLFVFDFMTPEQIDDVRTGVINNISTYAQRALNSATVFAATIQFPPGNFRLTEPLTTAMPGTRLVGASNNGSYFTAADGANFDMLRIAHQRCEVTGFIFRPGAAAQVPILVYAGRANIHGNYILAAVNNQGSGIMLTDINPVNGEFVPGAYAHSIHKNTIGDVDFAFANGITERSTMGITATRFRENNILSNRPIQINKGGANVYRDNLLQSSGMGPTGVGITLGAGVAGEKIHGNYFEGFQAQIETLNPSNAYQIFYATGNHNDNCTTTVSDVGAKNYVIDDPAGQVENRFGWSTRSSASVWSVTSVTGKVAFAADTNGNCFLGAASGASHIINRPGSTEATVILNLQAAGGSIGYIQDARGTGINGANTCLALNKNSVTGRSANVAGTVSAPGADYAEYMRKSAVCGLIGKGQIVGITGQGELTDRWVEAITWAVKSTDPSYVGGDTWAAHLGRRPEIPVYVQPEYTGITLGRKPFGMEIAAWEAALAQEELDRAAHAQLVAQTEAEFAERMEQWQAANAQYDADHEAVRGTVDRIAFAGQVPVNLWDAQPGDFIVPVQDGAGIKGIAVAAPTFEQYMRAVGKVIAIETDGRARIIVKVA